MQPAVRAYRPEDLDGLYEVCLRTARAGGDARGTYRRDRIVGDIYAAPYACAEPRHVYVLDDGAGAVLGYVLGTADTADFVRWYREVWIPETADRCPPPAEPPVSPDDALLALHRRPERMLVPELAAWPAHLHIDLLPRAQGQGWGGRLMDTFLAGLRDVGVHGVHLGVDADNVAAAGFYRRLGFARAEVASAGPRAMWLHRDTSPIAARTA